MSSYGITPLIEGKLMKPLGVDGFKLLDCMFLKDVFTFVDRLLFLFTYKIFMFLCKNVAIKTQEEELCSSSKCINYFLEDWVSGQIYMKLYILCILCAYVNPLCLSVNCAFN